jgi:hypothetical protein
LDEVTKNHIDEDSPFQIEEVGAGQLFQSGNQDNGGGNPVST